MIATSSENQCNTILWFSEPLQSARKQTCEAKSFAVVYPVDRAINKEISSSHKLKPKLLPLLPSSPCNFQHTDTIAFNVIDFGFRC